MEALELVLDIVTCRTVLNASHLNAYKFDIHYSSLQVASALLPLTDMKSRADQPPNSKSLLASVRLSAVSCDGG